MGKMKAKAASSTVTGTDALLQILTYKRPAYSATESVFNAVWLDNLPGCTIDKVGNRIVQIGNAPVLWSSHTDTVHSKDGMQKIVYGDGIVSLGSNTKSNCLGADDSAGVWIMREMVLASVPGLYIFHAAEEIGGIGSNHIAKHTPELLRGIDYAIALDRKGNNSVITHQMGRCASDVFARAMAKQLGGAFAPDDTGLFTDTANYTDIIPECTNLSVGYDMAHSAKEYLNVNFCMELLEKLKRLDVAALPVSRDPTMVESWEDALIFDDRTYGKSVASRRDMTSLVRENPEIAAMLLEDMGIDEIDFLNFADSVLDRRFY